jgi:hypothetical protein
VARVAAENAVGVKVVKSKADVIDWRTPNVNDLRLVAKVLKIFADSIDARTADKASTLLHGLFNLEEDLNGVAVETSMGLSRTDRDLLLTCHTLRLKSLLHLTEF